MIYNATNRLYQNDSVIQYIKDKSFKRVLDVGGANNPWAREVVTHYLDLNKPNIDDAVFIKGDICNPKTWNNLINGEHFDFIICTQTLEDVRDPIQALTFMPVIANEGYLSVPTKYRELDLVEGYGPYEQREWGIIGAYRGYFHHRWIFTVRNDEMVLFPKLCIVNIMKGLEWALSHAGEYSELSFFWKDDIPFKIINDDFMGPHGPAVLKMFREELEEGL